MQRSQNHWTAAALRLQRQAASASEGVRPTTAASHRIGIGTDGGERQGVGLPELAGQLLHVLRGDRVDAVDDLVDLEQLGAGDGGLADAVHAHRGALERQDEAALEVLLGAAQLVVGHRLGGEASQLGADDVAGGRQILLARPQEQADLAGVGVPDRVRAHGVGQAALLADLLEEAAAHRAAQDRVEHRLGVAPRVVARQSGPPRARWYCSVGFSQMTSVCAPGDACSNDRGGDAAGTPARSSSPISTSRSW